MSTRHLPPEKLRQIHALAAEWGKVVARRALEDVAPGAALDLAEMEDLAAAAARGLTEGTISTLLERQAEALPARQPCPGCGTPCDVGRESRPLAVKGGEVRLDEPVCHCPRCRRDFFPPPATPGA